MKSLSSLHLATSLSLALSVTNCMDEPPVLSTPIEIAEKPLPTTNSADPELDYYVSCMEKRFQERKNAGLKGEKLTPTTEADVLNCIAKHND